MEYRRLGTGDTADKTIDRNRSSLLHFNAFLESKGLAPFENLEGDEVSKIDLLREFGTYLCYHARNSRTDDLLMQNSAFGYMSGVKESIRVRYPDNSIFQDSNQEWYTKLRAGMGTATSRRCILEGVPISRQGKHVGRELVHRIGHALLLEKMIYSVTIVSPLNKTWRILLTSY